MSDTACGPSSTILRSRGHREMEWGGGTGHAQLVARQPPEGEPDWLVCFAQASEPGTLPAMPGVDRCLVLVTGEDVEIARHDPEPRSMRLAPGEALSFAGEEEVTITPRGRVRDLHLLTRRAAATGTLTVHQLAGELAVPGIEGGEVLVVVLSGWVRLGGELLGPFDVVQLAGEEKFSGDSNAMVAVLTIIPA